MYNQYNKLVSQSFCILIATLFCLSGIQSDADILRRHLISPAQPVAAPGNRSYATLQLDISHTSSYPLTKRRNGGMLPGDSKANLATEKTIRYHLLIDLLVCIVAVY